MKLRNDHYGWQLYGDSYLGFLKTIIQSALLSHHPVNKELII